tara:strand:- start:7921 stop:8286 length:366 start_codon:yes stop_codon:yes gene_type:complete
MNKKERPILPDLINEGTTEIESFQNKTLRPIIKMQHDLLILSFQNYLVKRKIDFENLADGKKSNVINAAFTKDIGYKNIILGFIIGHFTIEEFNFYNVNSSEVHKRIVKIIQKRIKDSLIF